jgi:undecaprenyl-diphosphatase
MLLARATFPIAVAALAAIWLGMLVWGGPEFGWDRDLLAAFHRSHDPDFIRWMKHLTELGGWVVLGLVGVAAVIALAFKRRRRAALLLVILFGGRMLVEFQKLVFGSPRPPEDGHLVLAESLGYPSAHAANSMITYVAIAALVPVVQSRRAIAMVLAFALAIAIGLTRLSLGVHWPSDVFGGWAFGLLWIVICVRMASVRPEAPPVEAEPELGTLGTPRSFPWRRRLRNERPGPERPRRDGETPR